MRASFNVVFRCMDAKCLLVVGLNFMMGVHEKVDSVNLPVALRCG